MAKRGDGHDFISRLLSEDTLPWLNDDELAKLRAGLAAESSESESRHETIVQKNWWRLKTVLSFNENLLDLRGISGTCADAQILLDFAKESHALTFAIDALYDLGDDAEEREMYGARELVISSAWSLFKKISSVRDAVNRQGLLTSGRKDALADLSRSLDFIAHVLRGSPAKDWGDRITENSAPPEVVKEWNGHWHTIRHTTGNMKHWASGMADTDIASSNNEESKGRGQHQSQSDIEIRVEGSGIEQPRRPVSTSDNRLQWLAKAMLLVQQHPDWPDAEIARQVRKNPGTLSRSKEYKAAAHLARGVKNEVPRGYIVTDPDSGLRDIEAVIQNQVKNQEDRGQPIPGSRYVREYCTVCHDPIKVKPDQVGKSPCCSDCE